MPALAPPTGTTLLDPARFAEQAAEVAALLKAIANQRRLMVLCKLVEDGEMRVGDIADAVGLSQSALSQHLSVMKAEGLVTYRRESQTLWYRIADPRVAALLATLHELYCQKD
jgi:ArsR family transcriptional regulator